MVLEIDGESLQISDVVSVARGDVAVCLSPSAHARMVRSYEWVRSAAQSEQAVYGVNTGFGSLARVRIPPSHSQTLSMNLMRSHAAGVGAPLGHAATRATMLLRANALAKGVSGCRPLLVETILAMLNGGVTPVLPQQGSCGSSGDLAPLAHLGLVMADGDHGRAVYNGVERPASEAMSLAGIPRIQLEAKDGLAITNGAQVTTALAALACYDAERLLLAAEVAAAMSTEALLGVSRAFNAAVHALRPYRGAIDCASNIRTLLSGSTLVDSLPEKVQDAYSIRCTPQVLGACRDTLSFVWRQISVELNAATDNPLILLDEPGRNKAFSAGMFHGEPVGMAMDMLKIAVAEIGSLSERRLYRLSTGTLSHRLPPGLARQDRPALGMLLPQTTAAALVSENKSLSFPATVDSIPTCEDQEDHVAMSTTAARRASEVVANTRRIVAIELLGASDALLFREKDASVRLGAGSSLVLPRLRAIRPSCRTPSEAIEAISERVADGSLLQGLSELEGVR